MMTPIAKMEECRRIEVPGGGSSPKLNPWHPDSFKVGKVVHLHACDEIVTGEGCDACDGNAPMVIVGLSRASTPPWIVVAPIQEP